MQVRQLTEIKEREKRKLFDVLLKFSLKFEFSFAIEKILQPFTAYSPLCRCVKCIARLTQATVIARVCLEFDICGERFICEFYDRRLSSQAATLGKQPFWAATLSLSGSGELQLAVTRSNCKQLPVQMFSVCSSKCAFAYAYSSQVTADSVADLWP